MSRVGTQPRHAAAVDRPSFNAAAAKPQAHPVGVSQPSPNTVLAKGNCVPPNEPAQAQPRPIDPLRSTPFVGSSVCDGARGWPGVARCCGRARRTSGLTACAAIRQIHHSTESPHPPDKDSVRPMSIDPVLACAALAHPALLFFDRCNPSCPADCHAHHATAPFRCKSRRFAAGTPDR